MLSRENKEAMPFVCVEHQTPADDPTLLESLTVPMYYEVHSKPEPEQMAKHYKAMNVKCDASTVITELSEGEVERLRAEGVPFHKINFT